MPSQDLVLPPFQREFRGVWVATVDNIDWPSKRTLSTAQQKAELIRILDLCRSMRLNAVILQVRPAADALYDSKIEPWSEYLTGKQGKRPNPYYDPLAFAVEQAHLRGLELHCWFNPYRAKHPSAKGTLAPSHIVKTHPEVVKQYGTMLWMDPGEKLVRERSLAVIEDVVRRYDVDGVHIDDYFYPYPVKGQPFPDQTSFARHGNGMDLADWRRENVNSFVRDLYTGIKEIKPWVKFGISPFGIYRPGYPAGIKAGVDQYADLYADALKWLQMGWCDYFTPQLYWPIAQQAQSYPALLSWWVQENTAGLHIWPGLFTSRTIPGEAKPAYTAQEVVDQISVTRKTPGATGHVHFSVKALTKDAAGVADSLRGRSYTEDALVPASPWLDSQPPAMPTLEKSGNSFTWKPQGEEQPFLYALWLRYGDRWLKRVVAAKDTSVTPEPNLAAGELNSVAVAAVDRCGNMSEPAVWRG